MTMLFRQICAFLFLIIFSGIFGVSAQTSDVEKNSNTEGTSPEYTLNYSTFGVEDGLSQATITSIVKDKHNYLWLGTVNGLNRFDGQKFISFYSDNQSNLPSSFIRSLLVSKEGILYVGTDKGLVVYTPEKNTFKKIESFQHSSPIWSLTETEKNILIGTDDSIFSLSKSNQQLSMIYNSEKKKYIKKIRKLNNSIVFKSYDETLYKVLTEGLKVIDKNVNDYIIENNKLVVFKSEVTEEDNQKITGDIAYHSIDDSIYLHDKSLYNYNNKKTIGVFKKNVNITSLVLSNNNIYVGTFNQGLIIIKKDANLIKSLKHLDNNVWSIFKNDSEFLVGLDDKNIQILSKDLNINKTLETKIKGYKYTASLGKYFYYGGESGLYVKNEGTEKRIINHPVSTIYKVSPSHILVGSNDGILFKVLEDKIVSQIQLGENAPIFSINKYKNSFLFSTQVGLYSLNENKLDLIKKELSYSLCSNSSTFYLGTDKAILKKIDDKFVEIYNNNKSIYTLFCNDKFLIAGSIGEVIYIDFQKNNIVRLDSKYGSQPEYNLTGIASINNSKILLGGINGLSVISIDEINNRLNSTSLPPTPLVNEMLVFNQKTKEGEHYSGSIHEAKKITLSYSEYPFTLKFTTPQHNSLFEYRLKGLSEEWIRSGSNNSATYTNLPSGNFEFQIRSVDPISRTESHLKAIHIEITPPWWLSNIAKLIYGLLCLLFIYLFIRSLNKKRQTQRQIAMSEERLKLSLWGSGDEMWDWDIETGKIYRSNIWESLDFPVVGQRADNESQRSNIHPMDRKRVHQHLEDHLHDKTEHFEISYRVKSKDNQWIWILDRAKVVVRDDDGTPMRMTGTIKNINDLKNTEEQLKLFGKAIENISEGMFILDHSFTFIEVNQACLDITQTTKEDYLGKILKFDQYPDSYSHQIQHMLRNHGRWTNEVDAKRGDGTSFTMDLTIDAIYDDNGNTNHYVAVFSDVSLRKQHEVELQKMSTSDVLTGLPNRSYLQVTLSNLVKRQVSHALMILDIDNFKKINDSLGHNVGDELLQMVTQRIITAVKGEANIYRLGGDEFAILIESTPDIGSAAAMANRVIDTFKSPIEIENTKLVVGASIGIVFYPDDEENEQALLRKAEVAMYSAKSAGGNRYHFYSESQNSNAIRQLEVENLIREGLANDYFEVYYQPKVNVKSNKLAGMEALVRLIHPEHGMISPAEFIPLAEETGLIVELGDIVLQKACRATQKWRLENNFNGRVAVNLSSRQFALPNLQERIQHILEETGLPAENLEIEITESTVIKHPERAIKVMEKLTQMGIHLALDDFGTGYSSLTYLKRFPIHCLKIDKAFIDDIDKSDRDLKMVDSIITIAHNMGLSVVAEGVEEQSQLGILRALKCEEIQGYLFSKPLPTSEFQNHLK